MNAIKSNFLISKIYILNFFRYKVEFLMGLIAGFIPIVIQLILWNALFKQSDNSTIFNYNHKEIISYFIFSLIINYVVQSKNHNNISQEIKEGNLDKYLCKPISNYGTWCHKEMSSKIIPIILVFLICLVYIVINQGVNLIQNLALLLAIFNATFLSFSIYYCISMLTFPFKNITQLFMAFNLIIAFLSGGMFPLDFFKYDIYKFLLLNPFQLMLYFPIRLLQGKLTNFQILENLILQIIWILILIPLAKFIWNKGISKYRGKVK